MSDEKTMGEKWGEYQPSKTLWMWSCIGCVIATIVVGFWFGGWVTGGTAEAMAKNAATTSRAELASAICVTRFTAAPDFSVQLAALKKESSWQQDDFIEKGGWTTLGGMTEPVEDAAGLCSKELASMEIPAADGQAAVTNTVVQ
ncbi:hypothetical protein FHS85_003707 [Rhodoligotrophos appendicifer]|uniref:hypothetical protein n=1 Tax=Rhodoligotrophos appendicifer TaxID=987056 RepID=UPI00118658F0|nr:hypothetical protein [Rhodoligotrophos appendicifer]